VKNLRETQTAVLKLLRKLGRMNDEDLAYEYVLRARQGSLPYQSMSGLRTRRSELVALGLVADSGERIKMRSGRQSIVWKAVRNG
jgi:hypothetical protein